MRRLLWLLALAACESSQPAQQDAPAQMIDSPPAGCTAAGTGEVTGSVAGAEVSPVMTAKVARYAGANALVLAETVGPNLCSSPTPVAGDFMTIYFCTKATGITSLAGANPTCPSSAGGATFAMSSGVTTLYRATSGMLTIESIDSACAKGTFLVTFDSGDTVTGSFSASVCP